MLNGHMSNFAHGFKWGISLRGMPIAMTHPGDVYWVDSGAGSAGEGTFQRPFTTLNEAFDNVTASNGDVILAKPGHAETVSAAAGIAFDVAGVAVIGLGSGSLRPTINFTTAVGADLNIDAANITVANFLFTGGIDALTGPIDVNAADCALLDIETRDVTGQATDFIVGDDNCDRLLISGWKHLGAAAAGADTALSVVGADDVVIEAFDIYGNFAVAGIEQVTTQGNRWRIGGGYRTWRIWTENAADIAITMKSDTTGFIEGPGNIMLQDNAANITECIVAAAMQLYLPLNICNLAGEVGMTFNGTASTDA